MKHTKFIIAIAILCIANTSLSQVATVGAATTNAGAVATFDSHNIYEAQQPVVAAAFAPALSSSHDSCMGSTSGAVSSAIIGIAAGSTYIDKNCQTLKNSRELWNMGQRAAAIARMCMDDLNRYAMELSGYECPQTSVAKAKAKAELTASIVQYTDPIIRERLGLVPLGN
jgi:hypothetical protein